MMIKTLFLLLVTLLIFTSCGSRGAMDYFDKNEHYERAMTSLQIGTLVENLNTKVIFKAIYLNHVFKTEYQDGEHFYISTHIDEDSYIKTQRGLFNKLYALKLNDTNATKVVELDSNETLRLEMPLTERWSRYYHVRFDEVEGNDLNLTFSHKDQGTILLKYAKDELEK